ncbi:hypothetical protein F7725_008580 [Dissostichus mawsoni]|uniref:Uncharacterized protein n=1 Tax=Dissostichus mawsoni TaxID=36200 RepID=A0A7J5YA28_DISMA|nr:hypothetical protein F7725_008580 [Dissostichus mawsoni]
MITGADLQIVDSDQFVQTGGHHHLPEDGNHEHGLGVALQSSQQEAALSVPHADGVVVTTVPFARPAYSVFHRLWRQRTRSERGNCCSNSRVVAADGLVTGPGVEAVVEARSCRDQQAAHLRAVEGSDGAVSGAGVQQPVIDLHRVHSFLMALERTFSGQIILTVVRGRI